MPFRATSIDTDEMATPTRAYAGQEQSIDHSTVPEPIIDADGDVQMTDDPSLERILEPSLPPITPKRKRGGSKTCDNGNSSENDSAARRSPKRVRFADEELKSAMRKEGTSRVFKRGELAFDESVNEVFEFDEEDPPVMLTPVKMREKKTGKAEHQKEEKRKAPQCGKMVWNMMRS